MTNRLRASMEKVDTMKEQVDNVSNVSRDMETLRKKLN